MCSTLGEWLFSRTPPVRLSGCGRPSGTGGSASREFQARFAWRTSAPPSKKPPAASTSGFLDGASGKETAGHNYYHLFNHDEFIGGILPPAFRDPAAPPYWQIYLQVSDCDTSAAKAKNLGAELFMPPMPIEGIGRMAALADPQGAAFAIFEAFSRAAETANGKGP